MKQTLVSTYGKQITNVYVWKMWCFPPSCCNHMFHKHVCSTVYSSRHSQPRNGSLLLQTAAQTAINTGTETALLRVKLSLMVVDFICTVGLTLDCPDVCPDAILRVSVREFWALIGI